MEIQQLNCLIFVFVQSYNSLCDLGGVREQSRSVSNSTLNQGQKVIENIECVVHNLFMAAYTSTPHSIFNCFMSIKCWTKDIELSVRDIFPTLNTA